jgi:predicted RNA polymerase sigma factor
VCGGGRGPGVSIWANPFVSRANHQSLPGYHLLPAVHADLLRRLDRLDEAAGYYREALDLATSDTERHFLERRLQEVTSVPKSLSKLSTCPKTP